LTDFNDILYLFRIFKVTYKKYPRIEENFLVQSYLDQFSWFLILGS